MLSELKVVQPKSKVLRFTKLSDLAQAAMDDLAVIEALPETYSVNMGDWVINNRNNRCAVCAAGAMIVNRLETPENPIYEDRKLCPTDFMYDQETVRQLYAVNDLRMGEIGWAWDSFHGSNDDGGDGLPRGILRSMEVEEYDRNPELFRSQMNEVIAYLRSVGL
jgi:hypothetical protein